jgi:UDP-N-acetylglucosamine acyltransferase
MGSHNLVSEHAVIGGDPQDLKFLPCVSHVVMGDGNIIREGVTIHRGSHADALTSLGNNNFLMAYCHVAHDCMLGDNVIVANNALLAGHITVANRAFISGNVVIHQFARIGQLAMLSGGARVSQDALPFIITEGSPARARGLNVVGLRRAGTSNDDIRELKEAYQVLLRSGLTFKEALEKLSRQPSALVKELIQFAQESKRGFTHARGGEDE